LYDADHIQVMPPEVERFLAAGPAPVVFSAGSAMKQARRLFEVSVAACRALGCRGLLVNPFPDQVPAGLPAGVMAAAYVPFSAVFPRAAAAVHHGGIGTTARALAAGVPQLVTPFAHDQFDNAARVVRLGAGLQLAPARYRMPAAARVLRRLMDDAALRARARQISAGLDSAQAIKAACDLILEAA
jgi:UDP:flavonoid glycosyltransferase YjiC (YdhE family)